MNPNVWGPHAWIFLHSITFTYPNNPTAENKMNMYNFFSNLGSVLPCDKCKINFSKHLEKHPLNNRVLCSRGNLVKWLIDIHNDVNSYTGKPKMSYYNVEQFYNKLYGRNNLCIGYAITVIICIILIIMISTWIYKYQNPFR